MRGDKLKVNMYNNEEIIRPRMIQTDLNIPEDLTPKLIERLSNNHKQYIPRFKMLQDYYEGKSAILNRLKKADKSNNKIVSGYPSYIVDLMQGMFVGKPVGYTSTEEESMEELQEIFNYNDEQDENSELAKMAGIKGLAYEIVYIDENAHIRFNEIEADNMIVLYDTNINPKMILAIRLYSIGDVIGNKTVQYAECYTEDEIILYKQDGGFIEVDRRDHYFNQVPVTEFKNNDEAIGDFERVISIIDAYDKANSDTANDFEEFTDALLILQGMPGTTPEDVAKLKEDKIILTKDKQGAYWLIKDINDVALENYKDRLNADIHKFSKIPDMSDSNFAGNASGVALEHKLLALEQVLANKERKFKRGLQKRIELIFTILNLFDKGYDYTKIDLTFSRNKPVNMKEAVEIATMLRGFTSNSTALSELPMIDNVSMEQAKIDMEKEDYVDLDNIEEVENPEEEIEEGEE